MQTSTRSNAGQLSKSSIKQRSKTRSAFLLPFSAVFIGALSVIGITGCGGTGGHADAIPTVTPTATPTLGPTPTPTPVPTATPPIVTITSSSVTVSVGDTYAFTASTSDVDQAVLWSIQEGSSGGTITAEGLYTAPAKPGTYHIVATSPANPLGVAVAEVVVQAGNALGVIQ